MPAKVTDVHAITPGAGWSVRATKTGGASSSVVCFALVSTFDTEHRFVNTKLLVNVIKDAVIVPTPAVLNGSSGAFVYVVKPDNTVTVRNVKIGPVDGERTSIASGLQVSERVVIDGSDRLKEGAKITIPADLPTAASHAHGASGAAAASGASGAHHGHHRRQQESQ